MMEKSTRHIFIIWAIMVAATIASWLFTEKLSDAKLGTSLVILIAALKVHLIIGHYMELGWQHKPWRPILSIWLIIVIAVIIGGYWIRW